MGAFSGGTIFGLIQGAFYKIGESFTGPKVDETSYLRTKYMLQQLALTDFERNFKDNRLDDTTLMLLSDSALKEAKVPPGPRLRILNYVDYYRSQQQRLLQPGAQVIGPNGQLMGIADPYPTGPAAPAAAAPAKGKGKGKDAGLP